MSNDPTQILLQEATRIVNAGREKEIPLRLLGAGAVITHTHKFLDFHQVTLKRAITDLDFMSHYKYSGKIKKMLTNDFGYDALDLKLLTAKRDMFEHPEKGTKVDVFYDELQMCHKISFKDRLNVDYPTISLSDILLEKMQIVEINEKDIKDTIVLLLDHEIGNGDKEMFNVNYISDLMSKDWGFYYTLTSNLKRIRDEFLPEYAALIPDNQAPSVKSKINAILDEIEKHPKSVSWKMRAKVGTKKKWYETVETVEPGGSTWTAKN